MFRVSPEDADSLRNVKCKFLHFHRWRMLAIVFILNQVSTVVMNFKEGTMVLNMSGFVRKQKPESQRPRPSVHP